MRQTTVDRTIEVTLPARVEMAATLRLICASLGADVGLSVDEIDDLRLAVSEVFASVAESPTAGRVAVAFEPVDTAIGVTLVAAGSTPIELDELAKTILHSAVADFTIDAGTVRFAKRSDEGQG